MKRGILLVSFIVVFIIISAFIVSAQPSFEQVFEDFKDFFEPLIRLLLDVEGYDADLLFQRFLFALIIVAIGYAVLERVPLFSENSFALWTVTISVAVLSVRFIATTNLVEGLLLPHGAMAISLLAILPFIFYFYFVEEGLDSRFLRRFAWSVYIAVFLGLWYVRRTSVVEAAWLFLASAVVAGLCFTLDGSIQKTLRKFKAERALAPRKHLRYNQLLKEREEYVEAVIQAQKRGDNDQAKSLKRAISNIDRALASLGF